MENKPLYRLDRVQIFSSGVWNGDEYSTDDLDLMVTAFKENEKTLRPFIKLGHSKKQELLAADGLPAAGWVENVYRIGDKLYADFFDIPKKIYELVVQKAYRKVSCEILCGLQIAEKKYKYMLSAVALLGAETPGVLSLDDILGRYTLEPDALKIYSQQNVIKTYHMEEPTMEKTQREIELEVKLNAEKEKAEKAEAEIKKFQADAQKQSEESKAVAEELKTLRADKMAQEAKLFALNIEKSVDELIAGDLITKGQKALAIEILMPEQKEYTIGEKKMSKAELVAEFCRAFKNKDSVNINEQTKDADLILFKKKQDEMEEEIGKKMADKKISYKEAYKLVAKDKKGV